MIEFIAGVIVSMIGLLISALIVMILWDAFIPTKFGLPEINYFEAIVVCIIGRFTVGH